MKRCTRCLAAMDGTADVGDVCHECNEKSSSSTPVVKETYPAVWTDLAPNRITFDGRYATQLSGLIVSLRGLADAIETFIGE